MLINWFTVGAQLLNFLILVWLMKRFLYRPILDAIDAREKRIAAELAGAAAKQAEAEQARDELRRKDESFDQQRATLLSQAVDAAQEERQRLLEEARKAADSLSVKRREALSQEQQHLSDELARRTRDEVFAIVRKALADLAGIGLEARMSEVFVQRLRDLDSATRDHLVSSLTPGSDPVLVRSAFDLPPPQRSAIQAALEDLFAAEIQVRFETAPQLINGIELSVNGRKLGWSITDYLAAMEKSVGELLTVSAGPDAEPAALAPAQTRAPESESESESESSGQTEPEPRG
ncbi:F0F1 ATP synthase subunit delta [Marinobacterium rhizophilum]|uniref:F0F1 ATP synthase subunit delta n=1 Tax=Marinobacterium rhizophilum TaxID=420402 RepID=UPI000382ED33|nr:F0F1 ATP synthase subunit delta [Marinobacterium rhizophilum]